VSSEAIEATDSDPARFDDLRRKPVVMLGDDPDRVAVTSVRTLPAVCPATPGPAPSSTPVAAPLGDDRPADSRRTGRLAIGRVDATPVAYSCPLTQPRVRMTTCLSH